LHPVDAHSAFNLLRRIEEHPRAIDATLIRP
jgi:hypothetical protein